MSVPIVGLHALCIQARMTGFNPCRVFPCRRSPDRRTLTTPRGLSQSSASFIAFWRLGIHHVPLVACYRIYHRRHLRRLANQNQIVKEPCGSPERAGPHRVEVTGFEPATLWMQTRCSPSELHPPGVVGCPTNTSGRPRSGTGPASRSARSGCLTSPRSTARR